MAEFDTADRDRLAASGAAMKDGSYPIRSEGDLRNAVRDYNRSHAGNDPARNEAIRRHIVRRAVAIGHPEGIPEEWRVA